MAKQIHLEKVESLFNKSLVVEFKSIERIIGTKKNSNYAKLLISNLLKSGKIKKVGKGVYTKYNESSLAVFSFKPSYLGLQSALSFHNLWEQETIPVILTTKSVRTGIREIMGTNILTRKINKKYLFGFELSRDGGFYLPYSDIEKTFIDMVVYNQPISEEARGSFKEKIDRKKLEKYLKRYPRLLKLRIEKGLEN